MGEGWEIKQGDCLAVLRQLADETVDCVVTSPPYWGLRDYGVDGQLGLEKTPEEYVARMVEIFREVRRVLRDDGTLFLNLGDSYFGGVGARRDVHKNGKVCKAPQDSRRFDCAYSGLCDECEAALSIRKIGTGQHSPESHEPSYTIGRGKRHQGSAASISDAGAPAGLVSTNVESFVPPQGECSHCRNCGACLSVLRSFSRDASACARMSLAALEKADCTGGNASPFEGLPRRSRCTCEYCSPGASYIEPQRTTHYLKPKDLVGIPWKVAFALQADGWYLRSDIIWHKPNQMPESVTDRPTKAHEYIFLFAKSKKYYYDADAVKEPSTEFLKTGGRKREKRNGESAVDTKTGGIQWPGNRVAGLVPKGNGCQPPHLSGVHEVGRCGHTEKRNLRTVWSISTHPFKGAHFATFPTKLVEPCILAGCRAGGIVLDPFAGSGTTGVVALSHGRRFLGIELNPEYVALAEHRVRTGVGTLGPPGTR